MSPSGMTTTTLLASLVTCLVLTALTFARANGGGATAGFSGVEARGYRFPFFWNRFPSETLPLYLTPYVEDGNIEEAQQRSRVRGLGHDDVESYAGYFTVDERYNSNMFFWFFPAPHSPTAPVLLWLNGGPGRSSMVGAMLENGPLELFLNNTSPPDWAGAQVRRRAISWTKHFSMIYIDNPVGVGYSYTANSSGLSRNMEDVSRNLYSVLTQFFKLFPQYSTNDFYVGGQSYAGKYVPSLGCYIHNQNHGKQPPDVRMNFKGIYLGAGYCDPEKMMPVFADFLFNMGFISDYNRRVLKNKFADLIQDGLSGRNLLTPSDYSRYLFQDPRAMSGLDTFDHALGQKAAAVSNYLLQSLDGWMYQSRVRHALHVGYAAQTANRGWSRNITVRVALHHEFLLNTVKENAFLMDNYKVLHYSGNLDVIVSVPMTEAFLAGVPWSGQAIYNNGTNTPWYFEPRQVVGYFQNINNFTRVILHNCGHMAPSDQPEYTLAMMQRFIFDLPFESPPYWNPDAYQGINWEPERWESE